MAYFRIWMVRLRVWIGSLLRSKSQKVAPVLQSIDHPTIDLEGLLEGVGQGSSVASTPWLKGEIIQEIDRFVQNQRSVHTKRAYAADLKQFLSYLRAEKRSGEDFDTLVGFRDWLVSPKEKGGLALSRGSANRKFASIRAFLSWLQARGKAKDNPSHLVKNFRAKTESPTQAFSDDEVAKILSLPKMHTDTGRMHSLILHMLFYLGLRRGELVALKASHLGWGRIGGDSILTLRVPGKGDKERVLPIPEQVHRILLRYLFERGLEVGADEPLFAPVKNNLTKVKTKPIDGQTVYYIVKKYAAMAGVDRRMSPHSCRATCISNALDHAASHRSVQELAGWSSPLMIERYDKRRTALKDSAAHVVKY